METQILDFYPYLAFGTIRTAELLALRDSPTLR
jgi:hypothetical protein